MLPTFGAPGGYGSGVQQQPRLRRMGQVAGQLASGGPQASPYATGALGNATGPGTMAPPTGPTQGSPAPGPRPMGAAPHVGAPGPSPYSAPAPAPVAPPTLQQGNEVGSGAFDPSSITGSGGKAYQKQVMGLGRANMGPLQDAIRRLTYQSNTPAPLMSDPRLRESIDDLYSQAGGRVNENFLDRGMEDSGAYGAAQGQLQSGRLGALAGLNYQDALRAYQEQQGHQAQLMDVLSGLVTGRGADTANTLRGQNIQLQIAKMQQQPWWQSLVGAAGQGAQAYGAAGGTF